VGLTAQVQQFGVAREHAERAGEVVDRVAQQRVQAREVGARLVEERVRALQLGAPQVDLGLRLARASSND